MWIGVDNSKCQNSNILIDFGTDDAECRRKEASGRNIAGTLRPLVKATGLQRECSWIRTDVSLKTGAEKAIN